jgi:hypothetical protein
MRAKSFTNGELDTKCCCCVLCGVLQARTAVNGGATTVVVCPEFFSIFKHFERRMVALVISTQGTSTGRCQREEWYELKNKRMEGSLRGEMSLIYSVALCFRLFNSWIRISTAHSNVSSADMLSV